MNRRAYGDSSEILGSIAPLTEKPPLQTQVKWWEHVTMTDIQPWIKYLFVALIIITVLNGICGTVISGMDRPIWIRHRIVTGIALTIIFSSVIILTRQPYAGIICFSMLIVKGGLIIKIR